MSSTNSLLDLEPEVNRGPGSGDRAARLLERAEREKPEAKLFERSLLESSAAPRGGGFKLRTFMLSIALHSIAIGIIIIIPLIYYRSLHERELLTFLISPSLLVPTLSPPSPPPAPARLASKTLRAAIDPDKLTAPSEIPKEIPPPPEEEEEIAGLLSGAVGGIPGGVAGGALAVPGGVTGGIIGEIPDKPRLPKRGPYRISEGVMPPTLLYNEEPPYTEEARRAKVQGLVVLEAVVRRDGSVGEVKVLKGLGYGLDESAVETVKKTWRFKPGMKDGSPADVIVVIKVFFELH